MKYSKSNPPMKCMMTQSTCYKGTKKMTVKGVLWHSTGANNPTLKRYVQPDDSAPDRAELLSNTPENYLDPAVLKTAGRSSNTSCSSHRRSTEAR